MASGAARTRHIVSNATVPSQIMPSTTVTPRPARLLSRFRTVVAVAVAVLVAGAEAVATVVTT